MFKSLIASCFLALSLMVNPVAAQSAKDAVMAEFNHVININQASAKQLQQLTGVGAVKAQAIVDYREKYGSFETLDGLTKVDGIGRSIVEKNLGKIEL